MSTHDAASANETPPVAIPEWVATLVGSLTIENAALRRLVDELQQKSAATE